MKTVKFTAIAKTAWGKPLSKDKWVKYGGEYQAFTEAPEIRAIGEWPSDADVVKLKNAQRRAAAKQKEMGLALVALGYVKPDLENSTLIQLKTVYKALISAGKSHAEARATAAAAIGAEWPSDTDVEPSDDTTDDSEDSDEQSDESTEQS